MTTNTSEEHSETPLIKFLAQLFRGVHYFVGMSMPPPGPRDRTFVFIWLGSLGFIVVFFMIVLYVVPFLSFG